MSRLAALSVCVAVLAMVGCAPAAPAEPPPADTAADVAAINALTDREMPAFAAGDTEALTEIFAADAVIMPPTEPAVEGHAALTAWTTAMLEQFTLGGSYSSTDVVVSGDWAIQRFAGTLSMTPKAGGDTISEDVKGVHILRRQADGSWQIVYDVWNASAPPPPMVGGGL